MTGVSRIQPSNGHTPTPWSSKGQHVYDTSEHAVSLAYCGTVAGAGVCRDGEIRSFGVSQESAAANAALIVEAVNGYAALKARITELEEALGPFAAVARVMDFYVEESMPSLTYPRAECQSKYPDEPRCVTLSPADFQTALAALQPRAGS